MSASTPTRFKWNVGGFFGSAVGAAAWMPAAALTSDWSGRGISLALSTAALILIAAYLLWRSRQRISAFCGLLSLLSVGFGATLILLLGAHVLDLSLLDRWPGGKRLSPLSCFWVSLFYPAFAVWFWFENRTASPSEPGAPPSGGPATQTGSSRVPEGPPSVS